MIRPREKQNGLPENVRTQHGSYTVRYFEIKDGNRLTREKKLCRVSDGLETMYAKLAEFHGTSIAIRRPNMPELIEKYCKSYFLTLTPSVQHEYELQYGKVAKAFEDFDVDVVRKKHCIDFLELNCKPGTRMMQAYKSRLVSFFRWASDRDYRTDNPASDIRLKGPPKNNRYPTDAEYHAIRDAMLIGDDGKLTRSGEMMQCFIDLLYLTAQRPTEIRLLRWSQIHDGMIEIKPSKTLKSSGKSVNIPITNPIGAVLDRAKSIGTVKGMHYVIHQRDGSSYTRSGIGSAWKRACIRAGIKGVTTRHMRPKATTDAMAEGYSLEDLQTTLAHTSKATTEGYVRELVTPISKVKMKLPKRAK